MSDNEITLREHFDDKFAEHRAIDDSRFESLESQFNIKISALEKATTVAAGLMDRRLEGMNEFRQSLKDQAGTFVPRSEYQALKDQAGTFVPRTEYDAQQLRINEDVRILRETKASSEVSAAMLEKRFPLGLSIAV